MIKISHVMTVYTIEKYLCTCITPFYTYITLYEIMKYFIYVLQARYKLSNLPAIHKFFNK